MVSIHKYSDWNHMVLLDMASNTWNVKAKVRDFWQAKASLDALKVPLLSFLGWHLSVVKRHSIHSSICVTIILFCLSD